jgi:hypothetical protein
MELSISGILKLANVILFLVLKMVSPLLPFPQIPSTSQLGVWTSVFESGILLPDSSLSALGALMDTRTLYTPLLSHQTAGISCLVV